MINNILMAYDSIGWKIFIISYTAYLITGLFLWF